MVNGSESSACSTRDRGLQFGDGLFETILCVRGKAVNLSAHWARLELGCRRLGIACPEIREAMTAAIARYGDARAIAKLIVTRGDTDRGYRCPPSVPPNWYLTINAAPRHPLAGSMRGVPLTLCRTRYSHEDPQWAGLKHLNRLPQVMARREWDDEYHDGLLLNDAAQVVEGCASNLFLVRGGVLRTPDLRQGGVLGVVRQAVINRAEAMGVRCEVAPIPVGDVRSAEEVFVTNAVFGIVPVASIDGEWPSANDAAPGARGRATYALGPLTARLIEEMCRGLYF